MPVSALLKMLPGYRLVDGTLVNQIIDIVNGLTGNGAANTVSANPLNASNTTLGGTLTVTPQLIASAGATQGNATAITSLKALVVTATASSKGVRLPTASTGLEVTVGNQGPTFGAKVYPATNGKIGAAATNVADTELAANKVNRYVAVNKTLWIVERGA